MRMIRVIRLPFVVSAYRSSSSIVRGITRRLFRWTRNASAVANGKKGNLWPAISDVDRVARLRGSCAVWMSAVGVESSTAVLQVLSSVSCANSSSICSTNSSHKWWPKKKVPLIFQQQSQARFGQCFQFVGLHFFFSQPGERSFTFPHTNDRGVASIDE